MSSNRTPIWPEFRYDVHELIDPHPGEYVEQYTYIKIKYTTLVRKVGPSGNYYLIPVISEYQFKKANPLPIMTVLRQFVKEVYKVEQLYLISGNEEEDRAQMSEIERVCETYAPWMTSYHTSNGR